MADEELTRKVAAMPRVPGVYLWKDAAGAVLYVGKAIDLRARTSNYLDASADGKTAALMEQARDIDFIAVRNEKEALVLEQTLIKRHRPRYNVRLNDDKQYPSIVLTDEPYPRLLKVHGHDGSGTAFGPFPDGYGAFHVLQALNDLLPLRRCRVLPKEKCLYYDIGKCIAPCIGACTDEEYAALVDEAKAILAGRGEAALARVEQRLQTAAGAHRFEEAARLRDQLAGLHGTFERQHMVQERLENRDIAALAARGELGVVSILHQREGKVVGQSNFTVTGVRDEAPALADFLRGYYQDRPPARHVACAMSPDFAPQLEKDLRLLRGEPVTVETPERGDKRRWIEVAVTNAKLRLEQEIASRAKRGDGGVEALRGALGLARPPSIIEGFDISHRAGEFTRAAMVRFVDGAPDKAGYRTFGMKAVGVAAVRAGTATSKGAGREIDDFAAIREAVHRRYRGVAERHERLPDLVVIDGGPGQLAAARDALAGLGLASTPTCALAKEEELVHVPGRVAPIRLGRRDPALQLLQRVRDEAHRFGIRQVRSKAEQSVTASPLDSIAGIGPKRRQQLVQAFAGLDGLRAASVEDLQRVPGITKQMAEQVVAALAG